MTPLRFDELVATEEGRQIVALSREACRPGCGELSPFTGIARKCAPCWARELLDMRDRRIAAEGSAD